MVPRKPRLGTHSRVSKRVTHCRFWGAVSLWSSKLDPDVPSALHSAFPGLSWSSLRPLLSPPARDPQILHSFSPPGPFLPTLHAAGGPTWRPGPGSLTPGSAGPSAVGLHEARSRRRAGPTRDVKVTGSKRRQSSGPAEAAPADPLDRCRGPCLGAPPRWRPPPRGPQLQSPAPLHLAGGLLANPPPGSPGSLTGFPVVLSWVPWTPAPRTARRVWFSRRRATRSPSSAVLSGAVLGFPDPRSSSPGRKEPPLPSFSLEMQRGLRGWGLTTLPTFSVLRVGNFFFPTKGRRVKVK